MHGVGGPPRTRFAVFIFWLLYFIDMHVFKLSWNMIVHRLLMWKHDCRTSYKVICLHWSHTYLNILLNIKTWRLYSEDRFRILTYPDWSEQIVEYQNVKTLQWGSVPILTRDWSKRADFKVGIGSNPDRSGLIWTDCWISKLTLDA